MVNQFIVVAGSPVEGFEFTGPYQTPEQAQEAFEGCDQPFAVSELKPPPLTGWCLPYATGIYVDFFSCYFIASVLKRHKKQLIKEIEAMKVYLADKASNPTKEGIPPQLTTDEQIEDNINPWCSDIMSCEYLINMFVEAGKASEKLIDEQSAELRRQRCEKVAGV